MKYYLISTFILFIAVSCLSCKKYLAEKSSSDLAIPSTPGDLQAVLDNFEKINYREISSGEISSDDYFINDKDYDAIGENVRRIYTWKDDNLFPATDNDWSIAYHKVYLANIVLDNVDELYDKGYNKADIDNIKGQALFIRSYAFFNLACTFALPYTQENTNSMGIPLRVSSDINEKIVRPTLKATFDKIIGDLELSLNLLPDHPVHILRASKPAALGLLSRVYLYLNDAEAALKYADACLDIKSDLISFNAPQIPDINSSFPFGSNDLKYRNPEIIYGCRMDPPSILRQTRAKIDTNLILLYKEGDNRKKVYYKKGTGANSAYFTFKGSMEGAESLFSGIATDEVYFNKAECLARLNNVLEASKVLNHVLKFRWDKDHVYQDYNFSSQQQAVDTILLERRKSLVMRGIRWLDIKRLNAKTSFIMLKRIIKSEPVLLLPNDLNYALAIPENIIAQSTIQQNPR